MALRRKFDNSVSGPRRDRVTRSEFLNAHIAQVRQLLAEGVPMLGYMHWSITDNYEWRHLHAAFRPIYHRLHL